MRRVILFFLILLLAAAAFFPGHIVEADEPVVRMILFWSKTCPACHKVMEDILPPIQEKYGEQLEVKLLDVSEPANYALFSALMKAYQVPRESQGVPAIFVGEAYLVGWIDIRDRLEEEIQHYLVAGGVDYPVPTLESGRLTPSVAEPEAAIKEGKPVHLAYFYEGWCAECDRAHYDLEILQKQYPQLVVESFSIPEDAALSEWLGQRYGVPEEMRLTAPAVFVGEDYLLGERVNLPNLQALAEKYVSKGADRIWENWEQEKAKASIMERFRSFGAVTVMVAGLVDGVNPCAFTTIIFFVSYLTISGRKGKEILGVGSSFTLGVFLAYLLVGVGVWKFLQTIELLTILGRWVYLLTAILCLFLALFSVLDYLKARRGKAKEMALRLPHGLRMRINRLIRQGRTAGAYVWAAFFTGLAVSIVELVCTGQVYLPTLIFVMSVPSLRVRAFLYLLLYNLSFVLPLVVIFVLAYLGTTWDQFARFVDRHTAAIKLAMAALFFALAGWLFYASV